MITPELLAAHRAREEAYIALRSLQVDALYAPWLKLQADATIPAVGVVVEPSTSMNKGGLSFGGRFLASAIFHELHKTNTPFRVIDARKPDLETANSKLVIVCSGGFHNGTLIRQLQAHADNGCNILIIGGEHRDLLGPLSRALVKADPGTLPVTLGYGQKNLDVIDGITIQFQGEIAEELGDRAFRFLHNPDTKGRLAEAEMCLPAQG